MAEETKKPKTQTVKEILITVSLNGKPMSQCAGLDVASLTLEGLLNRVASHENFILSISKTTSYKEEPIIEDGPALMSDKKEEVKPENPVEKK